MAASLVGVYSLLTSMQVFESVSAWAHKPVVGASSALRPDSPQIGGVALPGLRPVPDL